MKLLHQRASEQISALGKALFSDGDIEKTIENIETFFTRIGAPVRLSQAGVEEEKFEEIIQLMIRNKAEGRNYKLSEADYREIMALAK
jgi:alcohol dehydrogenase class IV